MNLNLLLKEKAGAVSRRTQADRDSEYVPVRHRAGANEQEEALKLKLLLQLCICSESLLWLTLTVFTFASIRMEQVWQQKKQVRLLITCCSKQLRQDVFLWAQMKQRRLWRALLWLFSYGKNASYLLEEDMKGNWELVKKAESLLLLLILRG